jgi:predicted DNA-binding transcriptional regulator AlpA
VPRRISGLAGPPPLSPEPLPPDFAFSSDWLRIPRAVEYSGLPKSTIYQLLSDGELVSFSMQLRKGAKRGVRFVSRKSIDRFLNRKAEEDGVHLAVLAGGER